MSKGKIKPPVNAAAVREAEQKAAEAPSLIDEITKATAKLRQGEMF